MLTCFNHLNCRKLFEISFLYGLQPWSLIDSIAVRQLTFRTVTYHNGPTASIKMWVALRLVSGLQTWSKRFICRPTHSSGQMALHANAFGPLGYPQLTVTR